MTSGPSDWINEGLAEYSAFRLSGLLSGSAYQDTLLARYRSHAMDGSKDLPIAKTPSGSEIRYLNRYQRTTLMFHQAARLFGQDQLDRLLRKMHQEYLVDRDATTESFLEETESQLGPEALTFFTNCLYNPRHQVIARETRDALGGDAEGPSKELD